MSGSREGRAGQPDIIDRSAKALIRPVPGVFFRLAGEDDTVGEFEFALNHGSRRPDGVRTSVRMPGCCAAGDAD
jgi:hypothetical protein